MALDAPGYRFHDHLRGSRLSRLRYLDWLRGLAILLMVESHVIDAWVRQADRTAGVYYAALFAGGLAAPLFMFLAGAGVSLAIHARTRSRAATPGGVAGAAARIRRRGWHIFGLALLFRVQAQVLGWGALINLFIVDILNVIGLSMVAAATLWQMGRVRGGRIALLALATAGVALLTPIVWASPGLAALPDPFEAYLRPVSSLGQFPLFPWAAFLFAGGAVGELVEADRVPVSQRLTGSDPVQPIVPRLQVWLLATGVLLAGVAWWASYQPALYRASTFWGSSPAFFGIRLGIVLTLVPAAWAHCAFWLPSPGTVGTAGALQWLMRLLPGSVSRAGRRLTEVVETMGRSSLFVYWVHVELVYGLIAHPIEARLPITVALAATVALSAALYALVVWKNRRIDVAGLRTPWRVLQPILK